MSLEKGCRTAIETCMGVENDEKLTIVTDDQSSEIGKKLREIALETTPHVRFFNLDIYGERPLTSYPEGIRKAALDSSVTVWTAGSVEGELETIRGPFIKSALVQGRHGHMVNITEQVVEKALAVDYNEVEEFTNKLYDKLKDVTKIKIKNPLGTNVKVKLNETWKWVPSTGICHEPGHWINLPDGEVFTAPYEMEGKVVIDGVLGDYIGNKFHHADLEENPLTLVVEQKERPQVVEVKCDNPDLKEEVDDYISKNECTSYIGELGLGTNIFLDEMSDNMLQDEKYPTAHIALGDPIAEETYADWDCPQHLDNILTRCDIWLDGEKIMEDGEYLFEV